MSDDNNVTQHEVTQEDLDNNPALVENGVKIGDMIDLPAGTGEGTPPVSTTDGGDDKAEENTGGGEAKTEEKTEKVVAKLKVSEDGMVEIPAAIFEGMMNDIQDLKTGKRTIKPQKVSHHTAMVKLVDDKYPILEIVKTWVENKGQQNEVLQSTVKILKDLESGKTENKNFPYLDLLNNVISYKVDIIKQTAKEHVKNLGMIRKTNPDPIKFSDEAKRFAPGEVENLVKTVTYESVVKFTEGTPLAGKEITISNEFLNM